MNSQLKSFEGIVLGENHHKHKFVSNGSPRFHLVSCDLPPLNYAAMTDPINFGAATTTYTHYRHESFVVGTTEFGMWVPEHWSTSDAVAHLFANYKPRKPKKKS